MISRWSHLKPEAVQLRRKGASLTTIEKSLNIPRSTLSGWLRSIPLTQEQIVALSKKRYLALENARKKAVLWHNQQKEIRLKEAEHKALESLSQIDLQNNTILELALAMLYLGEGFKNDRTGLGSSNPLILNFFITSLIEIYSIDRNKIKCELHLRADQDPVALKYYWSEILNIPLSNFTTISSDKRTAGSPTYSSYKGVCAVQCGNVAIQRRLVYLSQSFCEKIVSQGG